MLEIYRKIKSNSLLKYYILVGLIYVSEIILLFFLSSLLTTNIYLLNLILRILSEIFKAKMLLFLNVFKGDNLYYIKYAVLCLIAPMISTSLMLLLNKYLILGIFISKLIADILLPFISYLSLSYEKKV